MNHATRRHLTAMVIRKRAARWAFPGPAGRFRKWNQTCSCWACRPQRGPALATRRAPTTQEWA